MNRIPSLLSAPILFFSAVGAFSFFSGCANVPKAAHPQTAASGGLQTYGTISGLPREIVLYGPPPIAHSEPDSVVVPRLRQMEGLLRLKLEQKGYQVSRVALPNKATVISVSYDYTTAPGTRAGTWLHAVDLRATDILAKGGPKILGMSRVYWDNCSSPQIDSYLLALTSKLQETVRPF